MNGRSAATHRSGGSVHVSSGRRLILLVIGSKVLVAAAVVIAYAIFPYSAVYRADEPIHLATSFKTWDGFHYLWLSQAGYVPGRFENNFYPLFPALIRAVDAFVHNPFVSGLLVSNLLSLAAFYGLYRLVEQTHGAEMAGSALTLLIAFPTAFYLSLIYSESLFLLLAVWFFLFLSRQAYARSWLCAFGLALTRPLGVAILVPALVERLVARGRTTGIDRGTSTINASPRWTIALCAAPLAGFVAYLGVMWFETGNPFEGIAAQRMSVGQFSLSNLIHPGVFLHNFLFAPLELTSTTTSLVDRLFFVFFLALCPLVYRTCGAGMFAYALVMGAAPPLLGSFMSYRRFLLPVFPLFIALAYATEPGRLAALRTPLLIAFVALQILFLALHALGYWVA